ncbi:immunoglobulin-like domain-containing protein, partial [Enterovibrio norvegicus]|uniref:immunoglobulin-like domain-containing protein n=1 Tax=Enterovibrio norvegicus TaxID=188144 RepID=UPI00352BE98F
TSTPFDINNGEDVVVDASDTTYDVTVTGGDFESLTSPDSVTVSVEDTNDTVTVKLTASDKVNEGGKITYTATLEGGVAKNDITVTLANGETITIKANETSGEIDVTVENDIYASNNITNSIATVQESGDKAPLEDLQKDGKDVNTHITDDGDVITAKLSGSSSASEDGGKITYTIELQDADGDAVEVANDDNVIVTIQLPDGSSKDVTFKEGESTKDVEFIVNRDDVFIESDTAEASITGISGGTEFEDLTTDNSTVTTLVEDDIDTIFAIIEINGDKKVEESDGETITYTVTLVDQNGNEVSVPNNESVTINLKWKGSTEKEDFAEGTDLPKSIIIEGGESHASFDIEVKDDNLNEGTEKLVTHIKNIKQDSFEKVVEGKLDNNGIPSKGKAKAVVKIEDESTSDAEDTVSVKIFAVVNGKLVSMNTINENVEEGTNEAVYKAVLVDSNGNIIDEGNQSEINVSFSDLGLNQNGSADFDLNGQTITVKLNDAFSAKALDDLYREVKEEFTVKAELTDDQIASLEQTYEKVVSSDDKVTTTIRDEHHSDRDTNDTVYVVIESSGDVTESDDAMITYTVSLVDANGEPVKVPTGESVDVRISWNGSSNSADFVDHDGLPTIVTINGGESSTSDGLTVHVKDDSLKEGSESLKAHVTQISQSSFEIVREGELGSNGKPQKAQATAKANISDEVGLEGESVSVKLFVADGSGKLVLDNGSPVEADGSQILTEAESDTIQYIALPVAPSGEILADIDDSGNVTLSDANRGKVIVTLSEGADLNHSNNSDIETSGIAKNGSVVLGKPFDVTATDDNFKDSGETVSISLGDVQGKIVNSYENVVTSGDVTHVIEDEDASSSTESIFVTFTAAQTQVNEEGEPTLEFTLSLVDENGDKVQLEAGQTVSVNVDWSLGRDGQLSLDDFSSTNNLNNSYVFEAGTELQTISLTVENDAHVEGLETIVGNITQVTSESFESVAQGIEDLSGKIVEGSATVSSTVIDKDNPPVAKDDYDEGNIEVGGPHPYWVNNSDADGIFIAFTDITKNDTDPDTGDTVSVWNKDDLSSFVLVPSDAGSLALGQNGITFQPSPDYNGPVQIEYFATDGTNKSLESANIHIYVNEVNANDDGDDVLFTTSKTDGWANLDGNGFFTVKAFKKGEAFNADGSLSGAGDTVTENSKHLDNKYGMGVADNARGDGAGNVPYQVEYDHETDSSEALRIDLTNPIKALAFGVSRLFAEENGTEVGQYKLYDADGNLIKTQSFSLDSGDKGTFTIFSNTPFSYVVFEALPRTKDGESQTSGDASDFVITAITILNDAFIVEEGLTPDNSDADTISGSLFDNDSDPEGHAFSITEVNGEALTFTDDGKATVGFNEGSLTIWKDGRFTFEAADQGDNLKAGEQQDFNFEYTIQDEKGDTDSATVHIDIVGKDAALNPNPNPNPQDKMVVLGFGGDDAINANIVKILKTGGLQQKHAWEEQSGDYYTKEQFEDAGYIVTSADENNLNQASGKYGNFELELETPYDANEGAYLFGDLGNDNIIGGAGADIIRGGANGHGSSGLSANGESGDTLEGGAGADTFLWMKEDLVNLGTVNGYDHLTDFIGDFNVNEDKLDLSDLVSVSNGDLDNLSVGYDEHGQLKLSINVTGVENDSDGNVTQHIVLQKKSQSQVDNEGLDPSVDGGIVVNTIINGEEAKLTITDSDGYAGVNAPTVTIDFENE